MRSFMDEFDVQQSDAGGGVIVMAKRLRTAPADTSKTA